MANIDTDFIVRVLISLVIVFLVAIALLLIWDRS